MRIATISLGPLFPHHAHGGSERTLQTVLTYLGSLGHQCTAYCTRRDDNSGPFYLGPNVQVKPVLRFKQIFPEPYYTAPYNLTNIILTLSEAIETHDVLYIHEGELSFHFLYANIPTIIAFQDFVYPDTLANAFSFSRDRLVVNSKYVGRCVESVFSSFRPLNSNTLSVIPNGFDTNWFKPQNPQRLSAKLGLAEESIPILYPHRPDPRKGIYESIAAIHALKSLIPHDIFKRIKLLIPIWMDSEIAPNNPHIYQTIYKEITAYARDIGLNDLIHFHDWLPIQDMPEYYSLGKATLCIGNFIEAFGNVSVESELCGTPAILSRVAAQRYILPEELVSKVNYKDIDAVAHILKEILLNARNNHKDVQNYVETYYSQKQMTKGYANTILNAKLSQPLPEIYKFHWSSNDLISIPPWCSITSSGYYNDYHYDYIQEQALLSLIPLLNETQKVGDLLRVGRSENQIKGWVQDGFLLRRPPNP